MVFNGKMECVLNARLRKAPQTFQFSLIHHTISKCCRSPGTLPTVSPAMALVIGLILPSDCSLQLHWANYIEERATLTSYSTQAEPEKMHLKDSLCEDRQWLIQFRPFIHSDFILDSYSSLNSELSRVRYKMKSSKKRTMCFWSVVVAKVGNCAATQLRSNDTRCGAAWLWASPASKPNCKKHSHLQ